MSNASAVPTLRVFRGQPRWVLPALGVIVIVSALLYTWNIGFSGISTYYASAAKSMSDSWAALVTGAMNPSATMTLDKLSGFLIPQALSIRLFGFHAWALSLPQVIEGVITILAGYVIGARWRGPVVGIATAGVLAITPMLAAMFGRPMEDGMLTMTMVLAFAAWQRGMLTGGTRWLLLSGVWVAIGFQAKMMQAWLILPALLIGTLIAGAGPLRRRILQVLAVGAVAGLLSISWMTAIQLIPAGARPYIDGSTNDNIFSMVVGYNGIDRLIPGLVPGAVPQLGTGSGQSVATQVSGTRTADAAHSILKMVLPEISTQIGWLYPAALAGLLFEALPILRRRPARSVTDDEPIDGRPSRFDAAMVIGLFVWLAITAVVLSAAFVPHATYFGVIALPLALLAVVGTADAIRWYRATTPGIRGLALPILAAVQVVWQLAIVLKAAELMFWLAPAIAAIGIVGVAILLTARTRAVPTRLVVTLVVVSSLIAPAAWSSAVLLPGGGGSASDAFAGPRIDAGATALAARTSPTTHAGSVQVRLRRPFEVPPDPTLSTAQQKLVDYIVPRNDGRRVLFATDTMAVSVSVILYSRYDALPMGGFSRNAPTTDAAGVRSLLSRHQLRYVLLAHTTPSADNSSIIGIRTWVHGHCAATLSGFFRAGTKESLTLYDCGAAS